MMEATLDKKVQSIKDSITRNVKQEMKKISDLMGKKLATEIRERKEGENEMKQFMESFKRRLT